MTYRQRFDRLYLRCQLLGLGGVALFGLVGCIQQSLELPLAVFLLIGAPGLPVALMAMLAVRFIVFHCPRCQSNFGAQLLDRWTWETRVFRYCPECAFDFEQEIGTADVAIRRP
jgi:hypothetical protein